tara:strand:- start:132 stop:941 length:810 start_codon:yes stop_codon:yes gene_type:complete
MKIKQKVGIIGLGNMGAAIYKALLSSNTFSLLAYDIDRKKTSKIRKGKLANTPGKVISGSDILILAIKPQEISSFLKTQARLIIKKKPLFISIAAGLEIKFFQKYLPGVSIIRAMPNIAATVGESLSFISKNKFVSRAQLKHSLRIFSLLGETEVITEAWLNKVTAISGSGPGYVYFFMDSLFASAIRLGFSKKVAKKIVLAVFSGSVKLAKSSGSDFSKLLASVTSKKGTTEAGLGIFKKESTKSTIHKVVTKASFRAKELSKTVSKT